LSSLVFLNSSGQFVGRGIGILSGRPVWSPDGKYIYAINYKLRAIERWDAYGRHKTALPVKGLGNQEDPILVQPMSFSPSGKRAAMRDATEMFIADVGNKAFTVQQFLARDFSYLEQSIWLDEDHLLFVGTRDGDSGLWEIDLQSGELTKRGIDGLGVRDFMVLSPDAKSVIVTASMEGVEASWNLWQYSLETLQLTRLTIKPSAEDIVLSWRK
jgi:hypothetical protein